MIQSDTILECSVERLHYVSGISSNHFPFGATVVILFQKVFSGKTDCAHRPTYLSTTTQLLGFIYNAKFGFHWDITCKKFAVFWMQTTTVWQMKTTILSVINTVSFLQDFKRVTANHECMYIHVYRLVKYWVYTCKCRLKNPMAYKGQQKFLWKIWRINMKEKFELKTCESENAKHTWKQKCKISGEKKQTQNVCQSKRRIRWGQSGWLCMPELLHHAPLAQYVELSLWVCQRQS